MPLQLKTYFTINLLLVELNMPSTNKITVVEPNQSGNLKSYAVIANDMVYVSATYGNNRLNRTIPEMFIDEAHQAFKNLSYILEASGASSQSTIKVVIYLTSYKVAKAVNDIFSNYFYAPYCARLQMQVERLPKNARISVEAIAIIQPVNKIKLEN
ncbi:2-iminobutanoate/2-iminopropanoate deaminase-like [Adelges cooleyi]|uniref:2-iminobutanoate/2-iminopropanoate deaminase-like n=1 Tax=Adelges cooleyi TaxID=133065 RepID=UPI0021805368|nr:2-iminobutanoate/2-iminopropanoate deaminase-like [Adelges cooleyi]